MDFIYSIMNPEKGQALAEVKKHIEQLPIPKATDAQQAAIAAHCGRDNRSEETGRKGRYK
jgi:hypothetical protein